MTRELFDVVVGLQLCGLLTALSPISLIKLYKYYCERFESRSHFKRLSLIVRVNVVLTRTVVVDSD